MDDRQVRVITDLTTQGYHGFLFGDCVREVAFLDLTLAEVTLSEHLVQDRCFTDLRVLFDALLRQTVDTALALFKSEERWVLQVVLVADYFVCWPLNVE